MRSTISSVTKSVACLLVFAQGGCAADEAVLGIPCDVQQALDAKCLRCHGEELEFGAPNRLTAFEDFHEVHGGQPAHAIVMRTIEDDYMPPTVIAADPPVQPLSGGERATLLEWLAAGAPAAERSACE